MSSESISSPSISNRHAWMGGKLRHVSHTEIGAKSVTNFVLESTIVAVVIRWPMAT